MAFELRPRERPSSMTSRHGSHALADADRPGTGSTAAEFSPVDSAPKSVITSLAGFAGSRRPHAPGGRTGIPAALKYPPTVSRRMWTAFSMRRSDQPSRPSAITCSLFASLKTLLTLTEGIPHVRINVPDQLLRWPLF